MRPRLIVLALLLALPCGAQQRSRSWAADNGNGTYSSPLFYDEFSDPDMVRVGGDYYLTGTTMHTMPGLPVLHSRDLVNWRIVGYAFDRLDLGPDFRLEGGKEIYGQGIWAPSFRFHNGTYYILANVNRFGLQVFRATDPHGPWRHNRIEKGLHDLSVLFDDDGKVYAVYGARTLRITELNQDLTAVLPGTDRVLIDPSLGMGEGSHFYKIHSRYYIVSAIPGAHVPMKCARSDSLSGPWEVTTISEDESLGIGQGYRLKDNRHVLKNELVAGIMPCDRFGANAAWLRLAAMTHNLLTALKRLALPQKWPTARPTRLRFQIFCSPGKLVTHARRTWLRVRRLKQQLAKWIESLRLLLLPEPV